MTKKQIVWLLVRIAGAISVFNSLRFVFIIVENLLLASTSDVLKTTIGQASGLISGWAIEAVVYFSIGLYLLLNGKILFDLLDREAPSQERQIAAKNLEIGS